MRILFMGTPDFAKITLETLYKSGHEIVGIITQPDKPKGRKMILSEPEVKIFAKEVGLDVYQPQTLKTNEIFDILDKTKPDIIVVVAYGKLLPEAVLNYPKFGCINLHGSVLPQYRGAAPIQRSIMNGDSEVGITTMYMAKEMDAGDIIEIAKIPLLESDDFASVHDKLAYLGAQTMLSTLKKIEGGAALRIPQNHEKATFAPKIEKEDCKINFNKSSRQIVNQIRALSPVPLAFAEQNEKLLKIVSAKVLSEEKEYLCDVGTVISTNNGIIEVSCGKGSIGITSLVPEGKGKMTSADYINGRKIKVGDILR